MPFLRRIVELGVFGFGRMEGLPKDGCVSVVTLPETNSSHLKIGYPKRKLVFQPSIFKCYVSFREGNKHCDSFSSPRPGGVVGGCSLPNGLLLHGFFEWGS